MDDVSFLADTSALLRFLGNSELRRIWHRSLANGSIATAATAEFHDLTLLHYDADFVQVAEVTGQPTRWVADPGTID
ncbi:putative nuclease of putative toxin-antitoxin system [Actinoplanes lutulentus]|uniref:PIN domain-containing protein n=1 Tax=Actinoplanes lutulentus TaxID=1287878 RepID=A0A327ZGL1_9ACTN|nr:hypothetical protein [Actinoplanes lutulentus]MBB2942001.1 putative nuclease of putative toxin-antitoxin system [Actinoplanes lutulentus]RAK39913.1 hypothetical protein B0I29_104455 [Actinoplanes lutulentus]